MAKTWRYVLLKPWTTEGTEIQDEEGPKPVAPPSVALPTSTI